MSRLAVLAFTLTALPWSGESFVSTISSSLKTYGTTREAEPARHRIHKPGKRRTRHHRRRQLHHQPEEPEHDTERIFSSPSISSIISYKRSSSLLRAALITDPSPNGGDNKGPGWHRRILGKISRRRGSKSSSSLPSSTVEQEEAQDGLVDTFLMYEQEGNDFVVRNFDLIVPDSVLPVVQMDGKKSSHSPRVLSPEHFEEDRQSNPPVIDSEYFDVAITPAIPKVEITKGTASATSAASLTRSQTKRGLVCRMLENILLERLGERWPIETPKNLQVDVCESTDSYNNVLRLLFRGLFRADATLSSDRIVFPTIRFSSIKLQMERVTLNLVGFFQDKSKDDVHVNVHHGPYLQNQGHGNRPVYTASTKTTGKPRYPKQFDVHIEDITMSRHDLLFSSSIKNGLRQLLINVLKDRGIRSDSIVITDIDILLNGKISCIGEAKTHFPSAPPVRFEVRSGISFSNRGHVLTFPGLEVSLNRDIGLFVPVHPTLDLDVGHNTKFRSIAIDGRKKRLKIAASVTITPERTRRTQDYVQTSDAFSAIFFYDVGKWLTRLGRFSK